MVPRDGTSGVSRPAVRRLDRPDRRSLIAGGAAFAATVALAACTRDEGRPTAAGPAGTGTANAGTSSPPGTPPTSGPAADAYVPPASGTWERVEPSTVGWSPTGLRALTELVGQSNSRTLVVLVGGRIVVEEYWAGATVDTTQDVASCQKSVTSTLVGLAREQGLLALDDPVSRFLGDGWSQAPQADEARITVRHLLTMTSGLDERTLRKKSDPGTTWEYNTVAYQKLRPVLEQATGTDINALSRQWLFEAIGITASNWAERAGLGQGPKDPGGQALWGLSMTARDMARFGLLAQRRGTWGDRSVVPGSWFDEAWTPVDAKRDYGYLWWLLGRGRQGRAEAPTDWVAALGAQDQKIYVIPSLDVVLARQGGAAKDVTESTSDFDARLIRALLAARA